MMAVPAHPGAVKLQQPDGSYVTLRLVGDEWCHFNTTLDGYSVVKNNRGYYVYAEKMDGQLQPTEYVAHDVADRSAVELVYLAGVKKYQAPEMSAQVAEMKARVEAIGAQRRAQGQRATNYSKFKGLIVLVQYNDREFSRPDYKDIITDMVNKENYTGFDNKKRSGSVRDYFSDNSDGKFQPHFDVVGPYTVDFSQYDCKYVKADSKILDILLAAIDSADVDVNFKDYDGDGDGKVDLIFFIMAGVGANYSGNNEDLWWPHRSVVYNPKTMTWLRKDGVILYDYASSTELAGHISQPSTIMIDGIGTICHEFSHVLGLPDFYDANYEEDGQSITLGSWSVMGAGNYLNDGITPVGYSLYERYSVGFTDEPEKIEGEGTYTLMPLHISKTGMRIDSPVNNEFFLLENRQNSLFKWDAYLPGSGMLVYRVDKTNNIAWQKNEVNTNAEHNYYELVRACGCEKMKANITDTGYDPFPGLGNVTTLHNGTEPANLRTWSGKASRWGLFNIRVENGVVKFDVHDALTLNGLSLPETAEVGVSVAIKLTAQLEPDYAVTTLKWKSSNPNIAIVDENGYVTGVSEGMCDITVTSDNGKSASCRLIVKSIPLYNIAEFKELGIDSEQLLRFNKAEVLFASGSTAFVRDASGAIMLVGLEGLKTNDVIDGVLFVQHAENHQLPQALVTERSVTSGLKVTSGSEVSPREVALESLTEKDYCDLISVKAAKLVSKTVNNKKGVYLESGDRSIRFFNSLKNLGFNKTVTMPKTYLDLYFDVTALYATFDDGGNTVDAIYLMDKLTQVEDPTGIVEVHPDAEGINVPVYNLQGQRVSLTAKGLLIRNGRKLLNR
jgi:M6 family metalloprotease-like protein